MLAGTLSVFWSAAGLAQQQPANPPPLVQSQPNDEGHERILGVVPAFGVTNQRNAPALSTKQKFQLFARNAYDPFTFAAAGLTAGIGQANNSFSAYGQGAAGFGKRYGAALADTETSSFFGNFAYPVLFKQDPRYFRLGEGTIKHRLGYSVAQLFWVKNDRGARQFGYSNVLGAFTSGSISNAYYPPSDRGFGLTMNRAGVSLLYGALGGIGLEFWPDVDRWLFHKPKTTKH